ncbi:MAG: class II fructose-bisphosphate aldolase, partial [Dehalococcoidia bacterium]
DRTLARYAVRAAAPLLGAYPASIQGLYAARGRGEVSGFTVPAVNIRGMTYDTARALFRAMAASDCLAAVFELNRAEVAFSSQEPEEFAVCVLGAAIAEGHRGPVFIQGDHVQFNARAYATDPSAETAAVEDLVRRMVAAQFYNIDIDASTLVDLSFPGVAAQQAVNAALTARLVALVRDLEPPGVSISIGGEIGEVGAHNSTEDELVAYVEAVRELTEGQPGPGLSKLSVQTGTTHGGIPLPGGGVAEVALDFDALRRLGHTARTRYGMAGCVQHGASTLPDELFHLFPEAETAEVHLATGFQNLLMDHPAFPAPLLDAMRGWAQTSLAAERKPGEADDQFFYSVRKTAWGAFKAETWAIAPAAKAAMFAGLEARFRFMIDELQANHTAKPVLAHVVHSPADVPPPRN